MRKGFRASVLLTSGWMVATALSSPAFAQGAQPAQPMQNADSAESNVGLADIVVTAQKRSQNVQDTPLTITAVSGDALVKAGIQQVGELNRIDPALQISAGAGVLTTFIRGVGNPVTTAGNEASVPVYIDDVYFIRAAAPFFNLSSVERVEVLKGPQGTLFGRNASGGVISVYTRDPSTGEFSGEMSAGYANYDTVDLKGYINIPLTDRLAANYSVSYHNQGKGWGRNKQLVDPFDTSKGFLPGGDDYWKDKSLSMRGKILAELTDTTTVKLIGYYQNSTSEIGFNVRPLPGSIGGTPDGAHNGFANVCGLHPCPSQVLPTLGFYDVSLPLTRPAGSKANRGPQYDKSEGYGFSGRIDQELGFADLVSITAYRKNDEVFFANGNTSPYAWAFYDLNIVDKQFSQELQLKSKPSSAIQWIVGAFYLNADGGFGPTLITGPAVNGFGLASIGLFGQQKVKSYAGFGQTTIPIGDRTHVTAGLRYTKDKVIGQGCTQITLLPDTALPCTDDTVTVPDTSPTFKKLTWKGAIDHEVAQDVMIYGSLSRGFKAGTFNTLPLDSPALRPEVVDAYEIGLKSEMFDRRVRFNLALFWNDIDSPQVTGQRNGLVALKNAGSARTKGVEFDAAFAPTQGLTLRLAGSYLDAKFRDFPDAPSYCPSPKIDAATCATLSPTPPIAPGNINAIFVNGNGNTLPMASKWKFSGSVSYEAEVASMGKATFDLTANYSSKFPWDADNLWYERAHFLLNSSVSLSPESLENVSLRFWMKNITNRKVNLGYYAQASGSAFGSAPAAPRTYGLEASFRW
ncbi:TonB-dependent receptor [Sphingobium sp. B2]|uniref:TonB-dependent receptor n=1 Tax=Sphingobium sp. B2 TaxID=2583228 RepID=UPI0011A2DF7D|nr:TonB-dependent receptor [Sphingobium sp. B2]